MNSTNYHWIHHLDWRIHFLELTISFRFSNLPILSFYETHCWQVWPSPLLGNTELCFSYVIRIRMFVCIMVDMFYVHRVVAQCYVYQDNLINWLGAKSWVFSSILSIVSGKKMKIWIMNTLNCSSSYHGTVSVAQWGANTV